MCVRKIMAVERGGFFMDVRIFPSFWLLVEASSIKSEWFWCLHSSIKQEKSLNVLKMTLNPFQFIFFFAASAIETPQTSHLIILTWYFICVCEYRKCILSRRYSSLHNECIMRTSALELHILHAFNYNVIRCFPKKKFQIINKKAYSTLDWFWIVKTDGKAAIA